MTSSLFFCISYDVRNYLIDKYLGDLERYVLRFVCRYFAFQQVQTKKQRLTFVVLKQICKTNALSLLQHIKLVRNDKRPIQTPFIRLIGIAMRYNHPLIVNHLINNSKLKVDDFCNVKLAHCATKVGNSDFVKFVITRGANPHAICPCLAGYGHLELLQNLCTVINYIPRLRSYKRAAKNGHLHVLQWFVRMKDTESLNTVRDESIMAAAISGGHLHIVEWILEVTKCRWLADEAKIYAVEHKRLNILQWLHIYNISTPNDDSVDEAHEYDLSLVAAIAARHGHIEIFNWIREYSGYPVDIVMCKKEAIFNNKLEMLQLLHTIDTELPPNASAIVRWNHCNIDMLNWLELDEDQTTLDLSKLGISEHEAEIQDEIQDNKHEELETTMSFYIDNKQYDTDDDDIDSEDERRYQ